MRYCVTPEFPAGTYAYFLNISSTGTPQFPYMCNRWFYGVPAGSTITSVGEAVTNQFTGGPNRPLTIPNAPDVSGTTITLTWNAVEGGTYSVDASSNGTSFTGKATGLTVSGANSKTTSYTALGVGGTEYARVNRTALATYDTVGTASTTVAQATTTSVTFPNSAPTLTSVSALTGAGENIPFTISYATLAAAANEADIDGDASAIFLGQELGEGVPFEYTSIARVGEFAGQTGAKFKLLKDPVLADDGAVAFPATISVAGVGASTLWWKPPGKPLALLAQGGSSAGDVPAAKWKAFRSLGIAANRGPIFDGTLTPNGTTITAASANGVWATDYNGDVRLLFRTGDMIDGKKVRKYSLLTAAVGSAGVTRSLNNAQRVVWLATFTDSSQAIITTEIP